MPSIVAKCVNKIVLNRIQPKLDQHLRHNQNGFRPRRSTTADILSLRRLIEQASMICAHENFRARNVRANILLGARKNRARKILYYILKMKTTFIA